MVEHPQPGFSVNRVITAASTRSHHVNPVFGAAATAVDPHGTAVFTARCAPFRVGDPVMCGRTTGAGRTHVDCPMVRSKRFHAARTLLPLDSEHSRHARRLRHPDRHGLSRDPRRLVRVASASPGPRFQLVVRQLQPVHRRLRHHALALGLGHLALGVLARGGRQSAHGGLVDTHGGFVVARAAAARRVAEPRRFEPRP